MINDFKIKDISQIEIDNTFFHYTAKENLNNIIKNGLEPRIGKNSLYVEKSKKVFFAKGEKGVLTLMDVWLKWLNSKCGMSNQIYFIGTFYMRMPLCIKLIPNYIVQKSLKNKKKHIKVFNELKLILDNSVFFILDLKENIDFSYNDIDEVKNSYYESFLKLLYPSTSDLKNKKMEYWNMHTYSNKLIEFEKVSLLKDKNEYSASKILANLIKNNILYVKENLPFLYEYYIYFYN